MTSIFHSRLSKDFSSLLNDADDFDVIIQVGENDNINEFRAHSVILRARSAYFKSALSTEWVTKKDGMLHYNKPNITPIVFDIILKYIYTGELDLENHLDKDIFELLITSDELLLEELFEPVQEYLIKNHTTWIQENFDHIFHTVFELLVCEILQDFCLNIICAKPQLLFNSKNFLSLDEDILHYLLERNDLQINEIDVWDCLIKWGIEQTPSLGSMNNDRTKWNNEDYNALKKTLEQFIPLIRFVDFSSTEYFNKIQPYKAIIPNDIYEEIEEFYIKGTLPKTITLPPRDRIESNIIKPHLISIIINWIDKKDEDFIRDNNDSLYKFELIYQGSRDGISNESFKNKCNLQEPILVLIKCQDSQKIIGGYTPVGFYHFVEDVEDIDDIDYYDRFIFSTDSFIFHFEEDEDMKLSRIS
uniref:Btb/poz domain-containing protein 19-like n=1 Tax=Rhizophagus irregularis (strain DAOM 181602 / DAOM 197198 / MUCL 43194) TaxID=747089 RepID=U9UI17_RHIID